MRLIFCLQPRCGSSVISRSIAYSTNLVMCSEPFNPDCHDGRYAMDYLIHKHKIGDDTYGVNQSFEQAFNLVSEKWDINNTFIKHIGFQLNESDTQKLIDKSDNIIYLYRRNMFDAEISRYLSYSLRQETNLHFWNFNNKILLNDKSYMNSEQKKTFETFMKLKRPAFEINQFENRIKLIENNHHLFLKMLKGKKHMIETYEDFYADPINRFPRIINQFETKIVNNGWRKFMRPQNKICNENIHKLIENYEELKPLEKECYLS